MGDNPIVVILLVLIAAGVGYLAYSEYTDRQDVAIKKERVREGLAVAHNLSILTDNYFAKNKALPTKLDKTALGIGQLPRFIRAIKMEGPGVIVVVYETKALSFANYGHERTALKMIPTISDSGGLDWICTIEGALIEYLEMVPEGCRP